MKNLYADAPIYPSQRLGQSIRFPPDFKWGSASSAYQNEGSPDADGKSKSIWDTFTAQPGVIPDGSSGEIACDTYKDYRRDLELMKAAGLNACRFSMAWTRIIPGGTGPVNRQAIAHYNGVIDAVCECGMEPFVTAYHWDLPQALQERGGWVNREVVEWFADYCEVLVEHFGDRVKNWFVLNEPNIHAVMGYLFGKNAPGLADQRSFIAATHHQNLATGAALKAMRRLRDDLQIGTVISLQQTPPATDSSEDAMASSLMDDVINRSYLDPLVKGRYPDITLGQLDEFGLIADGDLELCHQGLDFLGVNYYADFFAQMGADGPTATIDGGPAWLPLTPTGYKITEQGLFKTLTGIRDHYGNLPVYISENGMADLLESGSPVLHDTARVDYFHRHLYQLGKAVEAGCNVKGYFAWTMVDNFEWEWGYMQRYGLVALDRTDGTRRPKDSYHFYASVVKSNRIDF